MKSFWWIENNGHDKNYYSYGWILFAKLKSNSPAHIKYLRKIIFLCKMQKFIYQSISYQWRIIAYFPAMTCNNTMDINLHALNKTTYIFRRIYIYEKFGCQASFQYLSLHRIKIAQRSFVIFSFRYKKWWKAEPYNSLWNSFVFDHFLLTSFRHFWS